MIIDNLICFLKVYAFNNFGYKLPTKGYIAITEKYTYIFTHENSVSKDLRLSLAWQGCLTAVGLHDAWSGGRKKHTTSRQIDKFRLQNMKRRKLFKI